MNTQIAHLPEAELLLVQARADIAAGRNREATAKAQLSRSIAEVARSLARQAQLGTREVNHATIAKSRAEICAADAVDEGQRLGQISTGGRPRKNPAPGAGFSPITLEEIGIKDPSRLAEWRKLRDNYTDEELRALEKEFNDADELLSHRDLVAGKSSYEQRRSSLSTEWYTPEVFAEAARTVLGQIDLDPASCEEANATIRAARYYTEADNGLSLPWKGTIWLNPPYSGQAGAFVTRLAECHAAGEVTAGIALITALTTDTNWFRQLWDHTLCFTYGRIQFNGEGGSSNTAGSVFIYLGPDPGLFQRVFEQFGAVVERRRRR
jgi:phage N-6-adenine-methyltransferase